jgi:hypothetical protein
VDDKVRRGQEDTQRWPPRWMIRGG